MYQNYSYEQRENLDYRDRQLPSPLKTIGAGAFSLLAFVVIRGAAIRGSSAASKALSRNLGRVVRSVEGVAWTKSYRNLRAAALTNARAEARQFGVLTPKDVGIAATVKEIPLIQRARAKFTTTFAKQFKARRQYYYRDLGLREKELYAALKDGYHPRALDQRLKALKTFMKPDGAFSARFMAAAGKWGERYAKMIPGFYVADQALGLFEKERPEHPKPAWYNIPGHVAGMVRFGIGFAPIDLAFCGALRFFRYGRAVAAKSAQLGVREFPHVREGFTKAVETLHVKGAQWHASISKHWAARRHGAWPSIQELKRSIKERKAPHSMDIARLYSDIVKDAKVQRKPYFRMEQQLNQILGVLGMRKDPELLREMAGSTEIKKAFHEVLGKYERRPTQTFIEYALKTPQRPADWGPRRLSTTAHIKRYAKEAHWDPETTNNALKLLGGKELYYGKNILRKGNFSMFNASFTAGKIIDVMGKWKMPFINWHPFERMMITGIPKIGIPSKGSAFRILDEKQSALMAEAAIGADLNVTRSPQLKIGEYFMRIGDHVFRFSPEKLIKRISGHWKVSVDTITAGERRHFQGLVESQTDYKHTGWLGHLRQKFELGQSPHFIGRRLKEFVIQDFNPESPHVLMNEKGKFVNMLKQLQGDKILSPREQKEFINYSRAVGRHLYGSEQTALEIFHNNQGLRGKVLDVLGGVDAKKAKKILNDTNIDKVIDDLSLFDYALPETYSQRTVQEVRRALHDVQNLVGADREFLLRSRATVVGQASNLTVQDYLMGQYFKKTLENYSQVGKITEGMYDKIFKSIDDAFISKTEKSKAKSLFVSMKINHPMADYLNQEVINSLDTVGHLKDIIAPNENLLREVFKLDYKSLRESVKINRFMRDTLIPLEVRGYMGPINEIWRVHGRGAPSAPKDLFGAAPGFGDMIKSDFKKFFKISDSATQINYEPYITKQSMLLNRWAIRPFNMTLGWIGLDLQYRSNAEFMKKFLWKRALAIPAAIYGYRAIDTFLTVNPLLDHTIFDDGLTSAGAQAIGKANIARAEVFDTLGITDFAQYMEGLMPGSVESPAAKLIRGAVLPILGRRFGGGPGLMIGLGASAATGFGLPDLTNTADELRDIYSGRKLTPVRSGRFWETSKLSYFGGRISSFQPSWYTKIVSQYKYTDAALGTKLESLLYTGPLQVLTDPYHYERCVTQDAKIVMDDGIPKPIKKLDIGDYVLSHDGYPHKILNIWDANIDEQIIKIVTHGACKYPICSTNEHRYLTIRTKQCPKRNNRIAYCKKQSWTKCKNCKYKYFENYEVQWLRADELKCGDYLAYPKPKLSENLFELDIPKLHKHWNGRAWIRPRQKYDIPNKVKITPELFRLFGYYLAEGCIQQKRTIKFSLCIDEMDIVKDIDNICNKLFGLNITYRNTPEHKRIDVYLSNSRLAKWFEMFGRGAINKSIPSDLLNAPKDCLEQFIVGFYRGDGTYKGHNISISAATISEQLIMQLRYILLGLGYVPHLNGANANSNSRPNNIYMLEIHGQDANKLRQIIGWPISKNPMPDKYHWSDENYIYFKIKNVEHIDYIGKIYDLKIENSHSFVSVNAILHNTHYYDRPYPTTAPLFSDIPVVGSLADMTIGRLLKPQTMMHEDELEAAQMGFDVETKDRILPGYNRNTMPPLHEARPGYFAPRHTVPSVSMKGMLGESFYRLTEGAGLRGFMTQSLLGVEGIGQYAPVYDDASAITSFGHQFWDMQIGGGLATEAWRRLYPRERFKNLVNPIRNLMPTWLPEDFHFGDPFTKIKGGLILLPSRAHEKMYRVKRDFPISLEYFGYEPGEAAGRLLKLIRPEREEEYHYSFIKELVQKQLLMNRQLLTKDVPLFDPWSKLEGAVDAVIMNQSGQPELMQIKATTAEKLGFMQQPKPAHVSQLNFAMRQMKKRYGQILYVAADNPELTQSFYVEYSAERFHNDMLRMNEARKLASDMLLKGIGQVGESYSYPDRLQVLANTAPWSDEYKKVLKQCKLLKRHGLLDEEDQVKVDESQRQHDAIMRKYDFYEHRFSHSKWLTPSSEYNLMSQNENIKAAAKYNIVERLMGAAWERLQEFKMPVISSKLFPYYTSEEMYERQIGGSFSGNWSRPIHDYIRPWWHSFLLSTGPVESAAKLGFAGGMFGGPPGAAIGVGAGLLYGAGRSATGAGTWVPGEVKRIREIDEYFDALEYIKNQQLYEQTGDPEYLKRSRETIYGVTPMSTPAEFYRSAPYMERPFFWSFASVRDKTQQDRIKQRVSPTMRKLLEFYWSGDKKFTNPMIEDYNPGFRMPAEDWMGWREDIPLEDIQVKTVKMEGYDAHDFGLGWKPQELRMHNSPYAIKPIDISSPSGISYGQENLDAIDIKNFIQNVLQRYGITNANITVTKSQGKGATISLNIS